eukprot:g27925.t1
MGTNFFAAFGLGFGEANFVVCCVNSKDTRFCTVCRLATMPKIWQQPILQNKTHLAQVLRFFLLSSFCFSNFFDLVVVVVGGGPAAVLDAGVGGLDTTPINVVFQASAVGPGEAADPNNDEIFLENRYYPCVLKVTFLKKESRLKQVAELKGLGERFLSLSVGAKYKIGTRVQVIMSALSHFFLLFFSLVGSSVILEMWHCSALAVPTRRVNNCAELGISVRRGEFDIWTSGW